MNRLKATLLAAFISATTGGMVFDVMDQNVFHSVEDLQSDYPSLSQTDAQKLNRKVAGTEGFLIFTSSMTLAGLVYNRRHPS